MQAAQPAPKRKGFFSKLLNSVAGAASTVTGIADILQGQGDYEIGPAPEEINANTLVKPLTPASVPFMHSTTQSIRVQHKEFLGIVPTHTGTGVAQHYVVNPGDAYTFPWLHNIARNFEQWLPCGMAFEFKSTSANAIASTSANLGTMVWASQYDVYQPLFGIDNIRMLNHFFAVSGGPHQNQLHLIECSPDQTPIKPLFIRSEQAVEHETKDNGPIHELLDATYDARLYDLCRLEHLARGAPSVWEAGELWITYDIILFKPRIQLTGGVTYQSTYNVDVPDAPVVVVRDEYTLAVTDVIESV